MSSHAPYPQEHIVPSATAPEGKVHDGPAPSPSTGGAAAAAVPVSYAVPMPVEAMAAPPVRTTIETTDLRGTATTAADSTPATFMTRVVTMQPCKIVYHYPDNTVHTYVLQTTVAAATVTNTGNNEGKSGRMRQGGSAAPPCTHKALPSPPPSRTLHTPHHNNSGVADSSSLVSFKGCHAAHGQGSAEEKEDEGVEDANTSTALLAAPCCTCGHNSCLAAIYKPPEYAAAITPANPRIGSPGPVTLFAFGFTTCLYNVHQAGICPMNLTTMGLICFYGGLAQFVGGFFELINKNTIFCTLDVTYGAFWMATAITNLVPDNASVTSNAPPHYMGGFFMLWFFFAATMFASAFKFSYVQMLLNFSVALNFFLNFLGSYIESETLLHVAGYEGIVEGCLATYVGMAFTMRDVYGRSILPLFFQKNFRITEW